MAEHFTEDEISRFYEVYRRYDVNNEGSVPVDKVGQVMLGVGQNPKAEELEKMIQDTPTAVPGAVDFPEFLTMLGTKLQEAEPEETLRKAFRMFDKDGNGNLSASELTQTMRNLGEKLTKEEIDEMVTMADIDGDGQVNYEEFIQVMFSS